MKYYLPDKDPALKEMAAILERVSYKHGIFDSFFNLMELIALSISTLWSGEGRGERLNALERLLSRLSAEEKTSYFQMAELLSSVITKRKDAPNDVLGKLFHAFGLHNKWRGQFFTPDHICQFMGMVSGLPNEEELKKKGYVSVNDPCCGSGALLIGYIHALKSQNYDPANRVFMVAQDIDIRCVWMCYVQLSLYDIPAVVIHGNSLALEEQSKWYTPACLDFHPQKEGDEPNSPKDETSVA